MDSRSIKNTHRLKENRWRMIENRLAARWNGFDVSSMSVGEVSHPVAFKCDRVRLINKG
jgi:hypothetical protein